MSDSVRPHRRSPPGSPVPGILQAKIPEWVVIAFSASVQSIPFLSFIEPIFAWNVPLVSNFLEEISRFSHSIVFLCFFALITEEGFLISLGYSLELSIQMVFLSFSSLPFNGNPLQYSCLENPMDGGAWWAAVHGVAKSQTRLSDFTFTFHFHASEKEMATHPSVLAWRIPGTAEPGGLPSVGSHRVGRDWSDVVVVVRS